MPNLASAKKNLRKSQKRAQAHRRLAKQIKKLLKEAAAGGVAEPQKIQALIDKAGQKKIFAPNKAARLKSRLMRKVKP